MQDYYFCLHKQAALNHTLSLITFTCKSLFFFLCSEQCSPSHTPGEHRHLQQALNCPQCLACCNLCTFFFFSFFLKAGDVTFNRAKLLNIGYLEALKDYNWDCFIFHDVDLVPENDHNLYVCDTQPKHLVVGRNVTGYR